MSGLGRPVRVPDDIAARHGIGVPGQWEAACHRRGDEPWYGLHRTGVTASGVPLPERLAATVGDLQGHVFIEGALSIVFQM
jgi:hypothetical protein